MDAGPDLISNVQFREVKRGYDPEQVHEYLVKLDDQVAQLKDVARQSLERAELAESRLGDVKREAAALERQLAEARGGGAGGGPDPASQAAGILAMAQKTADEAVADAERRARDLEAGARTRADEVVAEAEQRASTLTDEARQEAEAHRARELAALREEVGDLERHRDDARRDVDRLRSFLDERRRSLGEALADLQAALDDPSRLRIGEGPTLSSADTLEPTEDAPDGDVVPGPVDVVVAHTGDAAEDGPAPVAVEAPVEEQLEEQLDEPAEEPVADEEVGEAAAAGATDATEEVAEPAVPDEGEPSVAVEAPGARPDEESAAGEDEAPDEVGEPTQAVPAAELFGSEEEAPSLFERDRNDSLLGEPDEEADAAMRAFFESDLDDEDRPRWGFGRKR